jgi:hypothetical protein
MKPLLSFLPLLLVVCAQPVLAQNSPTSPVRERLSLDRGWLFHEGDIPFPVVIGHQPTYDNAKAGSSSGAASPEYDDSSWKQVDLPHDWAVEQPFDPKANISQGYRARGMGWYRKYFRLDPADHGKHLEIQLDGVSTHCTVWVNGVLSARNWTGYTSIYIDITPVARFGREVNTIAVQVDANPQEGWWYEGAGLYRHTDSDMPSFQDGRFAVYRAQFTPRAATQKSGGRLVLRDVVGKAQVWIDGKLAGQKVDPEKQDMTVAFPGRDGERVVSVLIEAPAAGKPAGLGGIVTVE